MNLKRTKLGHAIAYSLAVGAIALAGSGAALAQGQESSEDTATELDVISVTGTRLKSQTLTASSPVTEISEEEFQFSGATIVEDLVNQYPQMSPVFDNYQNNPSLGYATVDLRGMGANRTLTLVNGRRIPKGLGESADISIVPSALVQRVDLLTGGASAVYGSDAIAGVVNFVLDTKFEGVSVDIGYSAYQHDNDNDYIQGLLDRRGFDYPEGGSGFDGTSRNIDLAVGGAFGDAGHAMAWATWRSNNALFQGERDYSSCALNAAGTACGGSATADPANFYVYASNYSGYTYPNSSGTWIDNGGTAQYLYNFAPINYYQRPDDRITAGSSVSYAINEHFEPYLDTMFVNREAPVQIAPSGAFFTDVTVGCDFGPIGSLCSDLGIDPSEDITILVAKRNTEGGPRYYDQEFTNYSLSSGLRGIINESWSYDASFTFGRTSTTFTGFNDFLTSRIRDALLGCQPGSFDGCIPYGVWNDSVTPEQAQALQGVSLQNWVTKLEVFNAYVTGDLGVGMPWADGENIGLVVGVEDRRESFKYAADTNFATGNFAGSGSENPQINNGFEVQEIYLESNVPFVVGAGTLSRLDADLGFRYSDYNTSGSVESYKLGLGASFLDDAFKVRTGYNRAIRGASINELFAPSAIGLWSGEDPCAGPTPQYSQQQCANTGVSAARYGNVPANNAGQYNAIFGGNPSVAPEEGDTWTIGFAATPIEGLDLAVDYYDLKLSKQIGALAPRTIIDICANTGDAGFCSLINRNPNTGDLFRTNDGFVISTNNNFGEIRIKGIDLNASYAMDLGPGRLFTNFVGNYQLDRDNTPVPGDSTTSFDCAGIISPECQSQEWRHIASVRYGWEAYTFSLRWRYFGEMDYESPYTGAALNTDRIVCAEGTPVASGVPCFGRGGIAAYNYIDLSASWDIDGWATWTLGVNNIADKEPPLVGGSLVLNGNSIGGYDQAGRYIFTSLGFKF